MFGSDLVSEGKYCPKISQKNLQDNLREENGVKKENCYEIETFLIGEVVYVYL